MPVFIQGSTCCKLCIFNANFDWDQTGNTPVDSKVILNLVGPNSVWNGNAVATYNAHKTSSYDEDIMKVTGFELTLSNGEVWNPTVIEKTQEGSGDVLTAVPVVALSLNGGIINIKDSELNVEATKLSGNGTINLATDFDSEKATSSFSVKSANKGSALDVNFMTKDMSTKLTSDDLDAETAQRLLASIKGEGVKITTQVNEGLTQEGFITDKDGHTTITGPNTLMQSTLELASSAPLALNRIMIANA